MRSRAGTRPAPGARNGGDPRASSRSDGGPGKPAGRVRPRRPSTLTRYPIISVGILLRVSQRGLYALEALLHLAERWDDGVVSTREIAERERIPEKFLEAILLALRNARVVSSRRGREGGYRLRRPPSEIVIGDVVRLLDGPLAPFGDAAELVHRVETDPRHAGLFDLFLDLRNAAAAILDHTTLADLLERDRRVLAARAEKAPGTTEKT